jgi:hypothetical protein
MTLEIIERSGPPGPELRDDFCEAVSARLSQPRNYNLREIKFQRNLYYKGISTYSNKSSAPETDLKPSDFMGDYIAFILWE